MASWTRPAPTIYRFLPIHPDDVFDPRGGVMAPDGKINLPRIRIRKKDLKKLGLDEPAQAEPDFDFELEQPDPGPPTPGSSRDPRDQLGNR